MFRQGAEEQSHRMLRVFYKTLAWLSSQARTYGVSHRLIYLGRVTLFCSGNIPHAHEDLSRS